MVHRGLRDKEPSGCTASGKEPSLKSVGDSSSPEPEREPSSSRDDIERLERVECGFKRQAVHTPTTTRRSGGRRSRRSIAALKRCVPEEDAGVLVGSSVMLNQIPSELLETVLSYLARGLQETSTSSLGEDVSLGENSPLEAGSPSLELQQMEQTCTPASRSSSTGKGHSSDLAPVQTLFQLCARTCRRWNRAVRSAQVLGKLSMVRFPLPAAAPTRQNSLSAADSAHKPVEGGVSAAAGGCISASAGAIDHIVLQAGDELLDERVENILRVASKAGNVAAQFVLGLYLSRQKTFSLLCLSCPSAGSPAAEDAPNEHTLVATQAATGAATTAQVRRREQEQLRDVVLDTYDEGVQLLRTAADQLHPNALYQLGMLAFGGTDVKLRSRLFGHDTSGACSDCAFGEEHAELYWRRAAELGHLESRLIIDGEFRLNHLQELEDRLQSNDAERRSWRLCAGNRLLSAAKRPQSTSMRARECSHEECGMYTLLCEFKQCAGCASSHKKQRYCNRACQKRDWALHRSSCGWFTAQ